jgi:hypothetical protein
LNQKGEAKSGERVLSYKKFRNQLAYKKINFNPLDNIRWNIPIYK